MPNVDESGQGTKDVKTTYFSGRPSCMAPIQYQISSYPSFNPVIIIHNNE